MIKKMVLLGALVVSVVVTSGCADRDPEANIDPECVRLSISRPGVWVSDVAICDSKAEISFPDCEGGVVIEVVEYGSKEQIRSKF